MKKILCFLFISSLAFTQSKNATITLYKDGFGLVKQPIKYDLPKGRSYIRFTSIPDKVEPYSPFLSLDGADVLYQRYNYDIFDTFAFLRDHLGETIIVTAKDGKSFKGKLLDIDGDWITISKRREVKIFNTKDISYISVDSSPGTENVKADIFWIVKSLKGGKTTGEIMYISRGFDWDAGYRLIIAPDELSARLISQAIIKNETNLEFSNAQLQLVEGNLHRIRKVRPPRPERRGRQTQKFLAMEEPEGIPSLIQETLADYHFYIISEPLTFPKNESVTVSLYPERNIQFDRLYKFENNERASKEEPLTVQISFKNSEDNNLGFPLPGGVFQIYYIREKGSIEFTGEDFLTQVTVDEKAKVIAGKAFDVLGKRTVVNYDRKKKSEEAIITIEVKNKRSDQISAQLIEHIYGDWVIKDPSHNYIKKDAQTIHFDLKIGPKSTEIVTYTYRKEWQ